MRISFEEMATKFALDASLRSEDPHKKVGCCILNKEGRVLSIGYNGLSPKHSIPSNFWEDRDERRAILAGLFDFISYIKDYIFCFLLI